MKPVNPNRAAATTAMSRPKLRPAAEVAPVAVETAGTVAGGVVLPPPPDTEPVGLLEAVAGRLETVLTMEPTVMEPPAVLPPTAQLHTFLFRKRQELATGSM